MRFSKSADMFIGLGDTRTVVGRCFPSKLATSVPKVLGAALVLSSVSRMLCFTGVTERCVAVATVQGDKSACVGASVRARRVDYPSLPACVSASAVSHEARKTSAAEAGSDHHFRIVPATPSFPGKLYPPPPPPPVFR